MRFFDRQFACKKCGKLSLFNSSSDPTRISLGLCLSCFKNREVKMTYHYPKPDESFTHPVECTGDVGVAQKFLHLA